MQKIKKDAKIVERYQECSKKTSKCVQKDEKMCKNIEMLEKKDLKNCLFTFACTNRLENVINMLC